MATKTTWNERATKNLAAAVAHLQEAAKHLAAAKKTLGLAALVLVLGATGCGRENTWPDVEGLYSVDAGVVTCDGARVQTSADGLEMTCFWENVQVEGTPRCYALARFERASAGEPWAFQRLFTTQATCWAE